MEFPRAQVAVITLAIIGLLFLIVLLFFCCHRKSCFIAEIHTHTHTHTHITENENLVFRSNTFATKAVDMFMKMVGETVSRSHFGMILFTCAQIMCMSANMHVCTD